MEIQKCKNQFMSLIDLLKNVKSYSSKVFKNHTKCLNFTQPEKRKKTLEFLVALESS